MGRDDSRLQLYLSHRTALVEYATPLVGDRSRAEDVVQEAFLRFVPAKPSRTADSLTQPIGYLYRIVRNLALDFSRRRRHEQRQEAEPAWWMLPAQPRTPEEELAHRDELSGILVTLDSLSHDARLAVEMHRFGGYTLEEIADRLQTSVPTVHRLIRHALMQVASRVGPCDGTGRS